MILNTLDLEEVKKHLRDSSAETAVEPSHAHPEAEFELTGQALASRLGGLLASADIDLLEKNISASCEQEND